LLGKLFRHPQVRVATPAEKADAAMKLAMQLEVAKLVRLGFIKYTVVKKERRKD
jgi:hypothetical protein